MAVKRRRDLSDLIGEIGNAPEEREAAPGRDRETVNQEPASRTGMDETRGGRSVGGEEVPAGPARSGRVNAQPKPRALPKYLRLERKEARLREDQVDALASLARRVNRQKTSQGGERITENTLIRVAVDWLLSRDEFVGGSSEEEIRRGLGVPEPGVGGTHSG